VAGKKRPGSPPVHSTKNLTCRSSLCGTVKGADIPRSRESKRSETCDNTSALDLAR